MASKNVREHEARPARINNEFHLDPNTKRFKQTLIYFNTDTVCKFSGKSPLSSHITTLKQQINC